MTNFNPDDWLTPGQAREAFPGRPTVRVIYRWMDDGVGPLKTRLAFVRSGGRRFIHVDAISEFIAARNRPAAPAAVVPAAPSRAYMRRQAAADKVLAGFGAVRKAVP